VNTPESCSETVLPKEDDLFPQQDL